MRLRLPRFDDLRLGLRPDWYELPSHIESDEAWRLLGLLAGALDGIEDVLELEWSDLVGPLNLGPTTLAFVTVPRDIERKAVQTKLRALPVRFGVYQHAGPGCWPDVAWDEIEVKSALAAGLRKWVAKPNNPLASLGIAALPVDLLAASTSEPVELLILADGTIAYALRQHERGDGVDWGTCAYWSIGRRLADRLFRVESELRGAVRDTIAQSSDGTLHTLQHSREIDELVRVGLAHRHEGDAVLMPLARLATEQQIVEILDIEGVTGPEPTVPRPTQPRATTASEAIIAFDPLTPVMPGDPWFVDLRQVAPEIRDFGKRFTQQLSRSDRAIRLEILQETSGGATTMIRKLLLELGASGLVTIDVRVDPHPEFGFVDLLISTLSAIFAHCEDAGPDVGGNVLEQLRVWLASFGLQSGLRDYVSLSVAHDSDTFEQTRVRGVLATLERLLESIDDSPERARIRLSLDLHCDELIDHLAQMIDDLSRELAHRGQRLCLYYQGSARLAFEQIHEVFGAHTEDLARLSCHIVFGTAWATKQEFDDVACLSTEYPTLSYPSFAADPEARRAMVHAVLAARADLDLVFTRPKEMVTHIAARARGNLRASLELAKRACEMSPGQRLNALRVRERLSRGQLARRAGIDIGTVGRAERGFAISETTLRRLAAALGVELDDLMRPGPATLGAIGSSTSR